MPKKVWKKWTISGKAVFNDVFEMMTDNQEIFLHPEVQPLPDEYFKTTAWNAAWVAADTASNNDKEVLDIIKKEIRG